MAAIPESGIDVLMGAGGTPEGVLAACAMRCLGGNIQGKLVAYTPEQKTRGRDQGIDFNRILRLEDLVSSDDVFFAATGITSGDLLKGVEYKVHGATTDSIVMRGLTGTVRRIYATHRLDKLDRLSSIQY
jgi:fructose-1,6-bisphosphatase II